MSEIPCDMDLHPGRNINLTSWFMLSVLFLTGREQSVWSLQMSRIPPHTYLHPGRNIYLTSWFILSVLFLTHREMSVIPTSIWDPPSHGPPPWDEHLPDQLVHSVCVVFDRR